MEGCSDSVIRRGRDTPIFIGHDRAISSILSVHVFVLAGFGPLPVSTKGFPYSILYSSLSCFFELASISSKLIHELQAGQSRVLFLTAGFVHTLLSFLPCFLP